MTEQQPLLELKGVTKRFGQPLSLLERGLNRLGANHQPRYIHAVDQVSLSVHKKEVVGLVGESGCGKSTLARLAVGLMQPDAGTRSWCGQNMDAMTSQQQHQARMRAIDTVTEAPLHHGLISHKEHTEFAHALFAKVGLAPELLNRYPHQMSGGQRSRLGIARALAVNPEFLVCDEAVAALDVSIQAQVLNLFMQLRADLDLTYLFISHDLGVVRHLADRVVIMYLGRVVEEGPSADIFSKANHPYTKALLAEMPALRLERRTYAPVSGEMPSPMNPPQGCHFHPRCPHATETCRQVAPVLRKIAPGHSSACHLNDVP
jgi:peptide/nickel transport system ATP-binding protein